MFSLSVMATPRAKSTSSRRGSGQPFRVSMRTASAFQPRLRARGVGGLEMVLLDALAPSGRLASPSDSFEIFLDGKPMAYEVVELVAEAVSKDRVVHGLAAPV